MIYEYAYCGGAKLRIPLYYLFLWDAIRPHGFPANIERMKDAFKRYRYILSMGPFYMTIMDWEENTKAFMEKDREVLDPFGKSFWMRGILFFARALRNGIL